MNTQLRIDSVSVTNYRCFKKMDEPIHFEPNLTVLVARNGEGKTAFLDAVKIALGTFTSSFPVATYAHFHASDVHIATLHENGSLGVVYPVSLNATGMIDGEHAEWSRALKKAKGRTTTGDAKVISKYGERLFKACNANGKDISLPLIAFYGTGRLWAEHRDMDAGGISPLAQSRFAGYENALSARSTYKQVKNWLLEALQMEDEQTASVTQTGKFVHSQLLAIKKALQKILQQEGLGQMHYNRFYKNDITVINHFKAHDATFSSNSENATALPISWLSDGIRAVFSMVADIAYRCVKLNPHLGEYACEKTCGIILIDEVDIFLHPSWQQRILGDLKQAFPEIQFIVTTHSPQVVSSVSKECVRIVSNGQIVPFDTQTQGVESQDILSQIFGTNPAPPHEPFVQKLNDYARLEAMGEADTEKGRDLRRLLIDHFGEQYPPLLRIEIHRKFFANRKDNKNA